LNWGAYFHVTSVWLFRIAIAGGLAGVAYIYLTKPSDPPVAAATTPRAIAPASGESRASPPCQPIGRTASGKLVYSMDCRMPAASQAAGERAPDAGDAPNK